MANTAETAYKALLEVLKDESKDKSEQVRMAAKTVRTYTLISIGIVLLPQCDILLGGVSLAEQAPVPQSSNTRNELLQLLRDDLTRRRKYTETTDIDAVDSANDLGGPLATMTRVLAKILREDVEFLKEEEMRRKLEEKSRKLEEVNKLLAGLRPSEETSIGVSGEGKPV
jgi:hypothetical protein